ncbi:hypothetical protein R80B4_00964 [Fibrobacteres bacterium R8-0-B4]
MRFLTLVTPPAVEPVTLEEALVQCHADAGVEDAWFAARIESGRRKAEDRIRRSLITQTWALRFDGPASASVDLPRSPVQRLVSITVDAETVDVNSVTLNNEGSPARVTLPASPAGAARIEYIAGYGNNPSDVPGPIRDAILLYVAHSYGNREGESELPKAFFNLIDPYRLYL